MDYIDIINKIVNDNELTKVDIARALGLTKEAIYNKYRRNSFTADDLLIILSHFGYKIQATKGNDVIVLR